MGTPRQWAAVWLSILTTHATLAHTDGVSSVSVELSRITVHVPIDVVGGTPELLDKWRRGIDQAWNQGSGGRPFRICGREVRFEPRVSSLDGPNNGPAHRLIVQQVNKTERYVSSVTFPTGTTPVEAARTARWSDQLTPATAAHEFGHVLGLPDEYVEEDGNANGFRDPDERSIPDVERYPDAWSSLMAFERGAVLERHVREALRLHGYSACQH